MAARRAVALRALSRASVTTAARSVGVTATVPLSRHLPSVPWTRRTPIGTKSASARWFSQSKLAETKIWSFEEVQTLIKDPKSKVVLIDAREPSELASSGRIPGAVNIPITSSPDSFHIDPADFAERFGFERPSKNSELVIYCKAGVRSRAAAGLAKEAGWKRVGEYPGSWMDWEKKGGEVQR